MWSQSEGLLITCCELTAVIYDLKLSLDDGNLSSETCVDIQVKESIEDICLCYRWVVDGREFVGDFRVEAASKGFCMRTHVAPSDGGSWALSLTNEGSMEIRGWSDVNELRFLHGDNVRGVTQNVILTEGTYFVSLADWKTPINSGRWQSFPGLWVSDSKSEMGFVCGVLSQNVWKHTLSAHRLADNRLCLVGQMTPPGIDRKVFAAGEGYDSEPLYFELVHAQTPLVAFDGYLALLQQTLSPAKEKSVLRNSALWGSWNDRRPHFWDVSMDLIERTERVLSERIPAVRSLQIDDGYYFGGYHEVVADLWSNLEDGVDSSETGRMVQRVRRLGSGFAYEEDMAIAKDRFPEGMEAAARCIKESGHVPGIWLGLYTVPDAAIVQDHPDWFIDYTLRDGDDPELATVFAGDSLSRFHVLDPSVPEVREYICRVFEILFRQWKFEAFKLDFWSHAFENDGFRLRYQTKTAFEWRRWFFSTARSYLAPKSYFLIACDISTGNPFLSEWVDSVRYGIDIGNGKWESIRYSALSGTFLFNVGASRFYFLDPDSVALLKGLPENERRCFWAWSAVTRSLFEIAGDLAKASRDEIRLLQKLFLAPKNGAEVRLGEHEHLQRNEPAAILFAPGDLFSKTSTLDLLPHGVLAVFNWSDVPRTIEVSPEKLGLEPNAVFFDADFFETNNVSKRTGNWTLSLSPRSVRLSHISRASFDVPTILDSAWVVSEIQSSAGTVQLTFEGDSSDGFLLHWSGSQPPVAANSTLPITIEPIGDHIYRFSPSLDEDRRQSWRLDLLFMPVCL